MTANRQRPIMIPLTADAWATLWASWPLTEAGWGRMMALMEAMKPGLVESDERPAEVAIDLGAGDRADARAIRPVQR